ncbi:MAG: Stf0 family sulfotransferase [Henriciella sp.]|uniref:Stf0 family sulfotransferase n=1 Tax=Henriciella sp. TaxID=1968823 RepID=UPI003C789C39
MSTTVPFADMDQAFNEVEAESAFPNGPEPAHQYIIWFTARSGSSWLTDVMEQGGLGVPREWINPRNFEPHTKAFGSKSWDHFFASLRRNWSRNGIFGQEITAGFYRVFSRYVDLSKHFDLRAPSMMLFREDIVLQGISLFFATESGAFHAANDGEMKAQLEYDNEKIKHWIRHLHGQENVLRSLFDELGNAPKFASYERLLPQGPSVAIKAVSDMLGISPPVTVEAQPRHTKIGRKLNDEYRDRFIAENADYMKRVNDRRDWLFRGLETYSLVS